MTGLRRFSHSIWTLLFGIIPQSKTLSLFRRFSPEVIFKRSFSSMSSLTVTEKSPLVKGFHPFLMLTGFLPSMNTLGLCKRWMKAEGLSTCTGFMGFLLHVSLPMWNQGVAIMKGSLIFLHSKGFSPVWILLGQTNKGEWRLFIHLVQWMYTAHALLWEFLLWESSHDEWKNSCHKSYTHILCTQCMTVFGVGNVTWDKSRADTRHFPVFFAFIRLHSVNVLLLHEPDYSCGSTEHKSSRADLGPSSWERHINVCRSLPHISSTFRDSSLCRSWMLSLVHVSSVYEKHLLEDCENNCWSADCHLSSYHCVHSVSSCGDSPCGKLSLGSRSLPAFLIPSLLQPRVPESTDPGATFLLTRAAEKQKAFWPQLCFLAQWVQKDLLAMTAEKKLRHACVAFAHGDWPGAGAEVLSTLPASEGRLWRSWSTVLYKRSLYFLFWGLHSTTSASGWGLHYTGSLSPWFTCWEFPAAQLGQTVFQDCLSPHMSQRWAVWMEGSAWGLLICGRLTGTSCSEGAASPAAPGQWPGQASSRSSLLWLE